MSAEPRVTRKGKGRAIEAANTSASTPASGTSTPGGNGASTGEFQATQWPQTADIPSAEPGQGAPPPRKRARMASGRGRGRGQNTIISAPFTSSPAGRGHKRETATPIELQESGGNLSGLVNFQTGVMSVSGSPLTRKPSRNEAIRPGGPQNKSTGLGGMDDKTKRSNTAKDKFHTMKERYESVMRVQMQYKREITVAEDKLKRLQNECNLLLDAIEIAAPSQQSILHFLTQDPIPSQYHLVNRPPLPQPPAPVPPPPPAVAPFEHMEGAPPDHAHGVPPLPPPPSSRRHHRSAVNGTNGHDTPHHG